MIRRVNAVIAPMAMTLHGAAAKGHLDMINRAIHSFTGRLVRGLIGIAVFVQASQHVSLGGILALALGGIIVITAGADVAPRPAGTAGNA